MAFHARIGGKNREAEEDGGRMGRGRRGRRRGRMVATAELSPMPPIFSETQECSCWELTACPRKRRSVQRRRKGKHEKRPQPLFRFERVVEEEA